MKRANNADNVHRSNRMLIEFAVENFRSFAGRQTLNMLATSDDSLPQNVMEAHGVRLVRTAGIYGPNASGKSNLVKAFESMRSIVRGSARASADERLDVMPFLLSRKMKAAPTQLEVTFIAEGVTYRYGFECSSQRVNREWLLSYPAKRGRLLFSREGAASGKSKWKWGRAFEGEKWRIARLAKAQSLFLSVAAQFDQAQLRPVFDWFQKARTVEAQEDTREVTNRAFLRRIESALPIHALKRSVLGFMEDADIHLADMSVERRKTDDALIKNAYMDAIDVDVRIRHKNKDTGMEMELPLDEESSGTQRLFSLSVIWRRALLHGYVVFMDEVEASLHPLLTRQLISVFQNPKVNRRGAQLVFATHDTTLLDPELLRRDQVWLTEKDGEGATHLYSLSDYKERRVRKGEPLQKSYLAGRYGAIPILKSFGLHG